MGALPASAEPAAPGPALLTRMEQAFGHLDVGRDGWTAEAIAALRAMWDAGLPTAGIGKVLRVTKNGVVGKARRLGLEGRPSPIRLGCERPATPPAPRLVYQRPAPAAAQQNPGGGAVSLPPAVSHVAPNAPVAGSGQSDVAAAAPPTRFLPRVAGTCCWPMWSDQARRGDPDYGRTCGAPGVPGRAYCAAHMLRAFTPRGAA